MIVRIYLLATVVLIFFFHLMDVSSHSLLMFIS